MAQTKIITVNTGKIRSEETRKKMSIHQIGPGNHQYGKPTSEKQKRVASETHKGRIISDETKNKMRVSAIKRFAQSPMSDETKKKLSISKIGKTSVSGETHPFAKLKETDVLLIRKLASEGIAYKVLADRFGVRSSTIGKVVKRQLWAHVP